MPTYELRCDSCGKSSEVFLLRVLRDEDKVCPECGSTEVKPGPGGGFFSASGSESSSSSSAACDSPTCSPAKRSAFG